MRVCILADTYPVVTETFVYEPARWLAEAGHHVSVVARRRGELPPGDGAVVPARVMGARPPGWALLLAALRAPAAAAGALARGWPHRGRAGFGLRRAVAGALLPEIRRADCLLAHFGPVGMAWLPVAALARRPLAVYFHGYDASMLLQEEPRRYEQLFASGATVLTNSSYLAGRLIRAGAPARRVFVVPLGIDPSVAALGVAPEGYRVATVARLVPKKGVADALRAFAALRREAARPWEYEIVGDGPLRPELERLAATLGVGEAVRFRGFLSRQETLHVLRRASIFVLASREAESGDTEGTPVSILEAATLGLPILATRHAGIPEILPAGAAREGFAVAEGDGDGLALALARLAGSAALRQQWGEACARHARTHHSATAHVAALASALTREPRVPTLSPSHPAAAR